MSLQLFWFIPNIVQRLASGLVVTVIQIQTTNGIWGRRKNQNKCIYPSTKQNSLAEVEITISFEIWILMKTEVEVE